MKPLGDGFIRLISMVITLMIFCTVVTGIASMQDMKKVGRIGGKALLYFEIVSTLAFLTGMVVGNVVHTGAGFNVNPATLDAKAVADYAGAAKAQSVTDFIMHIIPNHGGGRVRQGRYSAGGAGLDFVRLRVVGDGQPEQAGGGLSWSADACGVRRDQYRDEALLRSAHLARWLLQSAPTEFRRWARW